MSTRVLLLVIFALVALRAILPAHAPALVDAHLALAALVLVRAQNAPRAALLAGALMVAGALVSLPTSWHPFVSLLALPAVVGPAAFLLLGAERSVRAGALWGLAIGGALNASAAMVQRFYTWPDALARHSQDLDPSVVGKLASARAIGLSLSPDLCGALCIAGAAAAGVLALEAPFRERRLLPAVLAVTSLLGLVIVRSFGSALALGAGVAVAVVVLLARRASRTVMMAALGGLAAATVALFAAVATRGLSALATSASERLANWRVALEIFSSAPLTGVGLARFPAAYLVERTPDTNVTRYAHSGPLHWLAETGLLGALLLLAALAVVALALLRRRSSLVGAQLVLLAGAVALGARTLIDYDAQVAQTASVLALMVGLLLADDADQGNDQALRLHRRATLAAALALLPIVVLMFWRDAALTAGNDAARAAEDGDRALRTWIARFPADIEPQLALGARAVDRLHTCQDPEGCRLAHQEARAILDAAVAAPRPSDVAFLLRARMHAHAGALELAERDVDAALALNPGGAAAHRLAVEIAKALGDDPAPRREAAKLWHVDVP